jgi:hypothetical protein
VCSVAARSLTFDRLLSLADAINFERVLAMYRKMGMSEETALTMARVTLGSEAVESAREFSKKAAAASAAEEKKKKAKSVASAAAAPATDRDGNALSSRQIAIAALPKGFWFDSFGQQATYGCIDLLGGMHGIAHCLISIMPVCGGGLAALCCLLTRSPPQVRAVR